MIGEQRNAVTVRRSVTDTDWRARCQALAQQRIPDPDARAAWLAFLAADAGWRTVLAPTPDLADHVEAEYPELWRLLLDELGAALAPDGCADYAALPRSAKITTTRRLRAVLGRPDPHRRLTRAAHRTTWERLLLERLFDAFTTATGRQPSYDNHDEVHDPATARDIPLLRHAFAYITDAPMLPSATVVIRRLVAWRHASDRIATRPQDARWPGRVPYFTSRPPDLLT